MIVKNKIAHRMFLVTLLFSLAITLLTTAIQACLQYQRALAAVEEGMEQIEQSLLPSIASSVWDYNLDQLEIQVKGVADLPHIQYARVVTREGKTFSAGKAGGEDPISRDFRLLHDYNGRRLEIGTLHVVVDRTGIIAGAIQRIIPIFIFQALTVFVVSVFLFTLFKNAVTRHLSVIVGYFRGFGADSLGVPLVIPWKEGRDDEIDAVVEAINDMRQSLYKSYEDLRVAQESLRESEDKFSRAFNQAPLLMTISDVTDGTYISVNQKFVEASGFTRDEAIGKTSVELGCILPEDRQRLIGNLRALGHVADMEVELFTRDKRQILCLCNAELIVVAGKQRVLSIIQDITQRKRMEDELKKATLAAETASRYKGEFLANMSHEIRTPLHGIMGIHSLLTETELNERQRELVGDAADCAASLLTIINDILDFSKIEANKLEIVLEPFRLRSMLSLLSIMFEIMARKKQIEFSVRVAADVPETLRGDPVRIRQILTNILSNAFKFTTAGSIELSVSAGEFQKSSDATGNSVVPVIFSIRDTGIGIAMDKSDEIFDMFTQADSSTANSYGGTGLGLAISKRLAEMMGGGIRVVSAPGSGSLFIVELPLEEWAEGVTPERSQLVPVTAESMPSLKILLAEDDIISLKVACKSLMETGSSVTAVSNGAELLKVLQNEHFDLVLTDISMPKMDGTEAARAIRALPADNPNRDIPIVAVTAHAIVGDRERFLEAGINGYISKPFRMEELKNVIAEYARKQDSIDGKDEKECEFVTEDHAKTEYPLDPAFIRERFADRPDMLGKLLDHYVKDSLARVEKIRSALRNGDVENLGRIAHSLAGASCMVGAFRVKECAGRLEQDIYAGRTTNIESNVSSLEKELADFVEYIEDPGNLCV